MKFSSASVDSHVDNFGRIGAITYCCYKISQCLKNRQSTGCPQAGAFGGASEAFRKRLAQHGCGFLAGLRPTRPGPAGNGNARKSFGERLAIIRGGGAFAGALRVNSLRAHDMPPLDDSDEFEPFAGFDDALFAEAEAVTSFSKRAQASRADKAKPAAAKERSRAGTSPSDGSRERRPSPFRRSPQDPLNRPLLRHSPPGASPPRSWTWPRAEASPPLRARGRRGPLHGSRPLRGTIFGRRRSSEDGRRISRIGRTAPAGLPGPSDPLRPGLRRFSVGSLPERPSQLRSRRARTRSPRRAPAGPSAFLMRSSACGAPFRAFSQGSGSRARSRP